MRDADAAILPSELRHVVDDLQDLVGAPIRDAWVPSPTSVVLDVGRRLLLLETWPTPRLHPLLRRPVAPRRPYSFQGLLRARLLGRLDALRLVGDDRVVELVVGARTLHARLFGRGGGIWLLDEGRVIASGSGPAGGDLPPLTPSPLPDLPPRFAPGPGERWADAARRHLEALAEAREATSLRVRLRAHLGRRRDRERRLIANLRRDLDAAERSDALRHQADCLAAALHAVPRGLAEVEVPDLLDPGRTVVVPLVHGHPPSHTLTRLYERAGRLERGAEHALVRLEETEARVASLSDALVALDDADLPALRALATTWELPDATPGRAAPTGAAPWDVWTGPRGEVAWVGRSDKVNHALVFRHARARDWWMHVRDRPGAHVVLPSASRDAAPPLDLLLVGAQLALLAGRVGAGERMDVQYARVGDLRPIKGAGPGRVAVREERVLHVVSEPGRLEGWSRASRT